MADENPSSQSAKAAEDLALEELLAGEQAVSQEPVGQRASAVDGPTDEEVKALEELLAVSSVDQEPVKDEEDQALDDLLAGEEAGDDEPTKEEQPFPVDSADEESLALEELVAAEGGEADGPGRAQGVSADENSADGIITLKEVVALGGTAAEEMPSKKDQALEALMAEAEPPEGEQPGAVTPEAEGLPAAEHQTEGVEASGLSQEETDDLDKLIKGLKEEQPSTVSPSVITDLQKQVKTMRKRVVQLTKLVAEYDKKMKTYSEIMRLFYKKSEIMNERIDALSDSPKGGKKD